MLSSRSADGVMNGTPSFTTPLYGRPSSVDSLVRITEILLDIMQSAIRWQPCKFELLKKIGADDHQNLAGSSCDRTAVCIGRNIVQTTFLPR